MAAPLPSLAPLEVALASRPFGLLCDVDGTISPIAPTPEAARVTPRNRALLAAIARAALVAAISGRNAADVRRLVGVPGVVSVGVHGLVWLVDGKEEVEPSAEPYRVLTDEAARDLEPLRRLPGLQMEIKTAGLTFHYRGAPDRDAARSEILRAVAASAAASRFRVQEGILLVELRPPVQITKGVALRRLAERYRLRGLIYLGDDITDIDAFREARRLRDAGLVQALGGAVAHPEAPLAASEAADFTVAGVEQVESLLAEIAARLGVDVPAPAP
jgi:trehalose 6-phosphate phosphatase